jgi:hypothetical protein
MEYIKKFLKGYRTVIFNTAVFVASLAEYIDLINVVSPEATPLIVLLIALANLILRFMTDTPVGQKNVIVVEVKTTTETIE